MAEVFDSLDRLYDLCAIPEGSGYFQDDPKLHGFVLHLAQDIHGQILLALADTIPATTCIGAAQHRCSCFEILFLAQELTQQVRQTQEGSLETVGVLLSQLRMALHSIDT